MEKEILGAIAYKAKGDITLEDLALLKSNTEAAVGLALIELENATGLKVKGVYLSLNRDDLGNPKVEITLNI